MTNRFRLKQSVSTERLDGETIAIDFRSGRFYSFRESAADILWLICNRVDVSYFDGVVRRHFQLINDSGSIGLEIRAFIETLAGLDLIEPDDSPEDITQVDVGALNLPDDYERSEWRSPLLISNDQLTDLLKIDPIHDVSEGGWPDAPKS